MSRVPLDPCPTCGLDPGLVQDLIDAGLELVRLHQQHYNPPGSVGTAIDRFQQLVRQHEEGP